MTPRRAAPARRSALMDSRVYLVNPEGASPNMEVTRQLTREPLFPQKEKNISRNWLCNYINSLGYVRACGRAPLQLSEDLRRAADGVIFQPESRFAAAVGGRAEQSRAA